MEDLDQERMKLMQELAENLEHIFEAEGPEKYLEYMLTLKYQKPRPKPSWLKLWYNKSAPGIFLALVVSILLRLAAKLFGLNNWQYGLHFWLPLCLFPVLCPIQAKILFNSLAIPLFYERDREQDHTTEEITGYLDSVFILSGYVGWLFALQVIAWLLSSFGFFLGRPILTCTVFVLIFSCGYLVSRQDTWLAHGRAKMNAWVVSISLWIGNYYIRTRIRLLKCLDWLANSYAIGLSSSCIKSTLLFLLCQPNIDRLENFKYQPLVTSKRYIRLLRIHKRIPFCDLRCELIYMPLDEAGMYQAISYYWGEDFQKSCRIILDNHRFGVTPTVYNILRRRSSIFASRLIWIDSICINQEDNSEKGGQVRIMNEIYERASRVFVCLGSAKDADLGLSLLHELIIASGLVSKSQLAKHILGFLSRIERGDELLKSRLASLMDILRHPWFGRVWIIQEVVMAKSITVLYGKGELSWGYMMLLMKMFGDREMSEILPHFQYPGRIHPDVSIPMNPAKALSLAQFQKDFVEGKRVPLNETLRTFSSFKSTCPRDKIFALLGFVEPAPGVLELIDYDKSLSDVLYDVTQYLHFREGSLLATLQFAGIGWDNIEPGCPSWVPNWTISREPTTLAHCGDYRIQYKAAMRVNPQVSLLSEARLLKIRGQKLDKIKLLSTIPDFAPKPHIPTIEELEESSLLFERIQLLAETHCGKFYPQPMSDLSTEQSTREAFWRTLIGDRTRSARPAPSSYPTLFPKFIETNFRALLEKHKSDPQKIKMAGADKSDPEILREVILSNYRSNFETLEEGMAFDRDIHNAGWLFGQPDFPRNFCITEGGMVGMVPKYTEIGDVVALIYGAQVPFVLRNVSGDGETEYQLVGECYIHGIMDGQGLKVGDLGEDFTIR